MWGRCVDTSLSVPCSQAHSPGLMPVPCILRMAAGGSFSVGLSSLWELCLRAGNIQFPTSPSSLPQQPLPLLHFITPPPAEF